MGPELEVLVFLYEWTYWDPATDTNVTRSSPHLVTKEHFDKRVDEHPTLKRRILRGTVIQVPASSVIDGICHTNLIREGFFDEKERA